MGILHRSVLVGTLLLASGGIAVSEEKPAQKVEAVRRETKECVKELVRHVGRDKRGWDVAETENFRLYHDYSKKEIEEIGLKIEKIRADVHIKWCKVVGDKWERPCDVYFYPDGEKYTNATGIPASSPGNSAITMDSGRVVKRAIHIRKDAVNILTTVIPHEVTHGSMAEKFDGVYPPRWVDEGMAVLAESKESQERHIKNLQNLRKQHGLYTAEQIFTMTDYPEQKYVGLFYSQSTSLTAFLVQRKDPPTLVAFVREGKRKGYAAAAKTHYDFESLDVLDRAWQAHVFGVPKMKRRLLR